MDPIAKDIVPIRIEDEMRDSYMVQNNDQQTACIFQSYLPSPMTIVYFPRSAS